MSENTLKGTHVYAAINAVQLAMSKEGIEKGRKNQQQGYAFRGIDDVYASLSPHLATHRLCILPRVLERTVLEKETKTGSTLFYTTLRVEFDFVSAVDGSKHTVCTVGEAMDTGDKSSNKAMSAAYKYAAFMAFCIPTEGDNDADATTHEPKAGGTKPSASTTKKDPKPPAADPKAPKIGDDEPALDDQISELNALSIDDYAIPTFTAAMKYYKQTDLKKLTQKQARTIIKKCNDAIHVAKSPKA